MDRAAKTIPVAPPSGAAVGEREQEGERAAVQREQVAVPQEQELRRALAVRREAVARAAAAVERSWIQTRCLQRPMAPPMPAAHSVIR